jgi:hypothetical protein
LEDLMRFCPLLIILLLGACSDDSMTRNFGVRRDAAPQTMASTQMPLSAPPNLAVRPSRPGAPIPGGEDRRQTGQAVGSAGQDALLQAAGPAPTADIRTLINENAGMVYPGPSFVDAVLNWTPPPGYTPLTAPARKSWFSRLF